MTDEILHLTKALADVGVTIVIAGIFLYGVIKLMSIGLNTLSNRLDRKNHDKLLDLRTEIDEKVNNEISEFFRLHEGKRLQLIEFTNTVTSVAYLPFKYMQCTHEVFGYEDSSEARNIDKLSTSLFSPFFSSLAKNAYVIVKQAGEADGIQNGSIHDLFHSMGMDNSLCVMLKTTRKKAIGYVAFASEKYFSEQDIADMLDLGNRLSGLLSVLDT